MPRALTYGLVGIGTELNPPIIQVFDQTVVPTNGNTSGALSESGSPVPPGGNPCAGHLGTDLNVTVSGITICPPNTDTLPSGAYTLNYNSSLSSPTQCTWVYNLSAFPTIAVQYTKATGVWISTVQVASGEAFECITGATTSPIMNNDFTTCTPGVNVATGGTITAMP